MSNILYVKHGDTLPVINCQILSSSGIPVVIPMGATVTFRMRPSIGGDLKVNATATIVDANLGKVSYALTSTDTDTIGDYYIEWVVSGFGVETVPTSSYIIIVVSPILTDTIVGSVPSIATVTGPQGPAGTLDITTAALNLFVDSAGSNSNTGLSGSPVQTLQAAINKVPKIIKHPVTITVGAGNFAGAVVTGFSVQAPSAYDTANSYLHIQGTYQDVKSASTLTGFTAASGATFAVATDSTASMTVDQYKGMFLEVTSGTGSTSTLARPARWLITSNTATAFTLTGSGLTAPAAASGYKVVRPATFINSGLAGFAASNSPANISLPISTASGLAFLNNSGAAYSVQGVEFSLSASLTRGLVTQEHRVAVTDCRFIGSAGTFFPLVYSNFQTPLAAPVLFCVYIDMGATGSVGISESTTGGAVSAATASLTSVFINGGSLGFNLGGNTTGPLINNCMFKGQSFAGISLLSVGLMQMVNCRVDNCTTGVDTTESSTGGLGMTTFAINACDISNCTVAGVSLRGPFCGTFLTNVSGTGNLIGVKLARGSKAAIAASVTLTGTTELSIDGAANTYATMRAASPKVLTNANYYTLAYE
jgi:hypothetical protein